MKAATLVTHLDCLCASVTFASGLRSESLHFPSKMFFERTLDGSSVKAVVRRRSAVHQKLVLGLGTHRRGLRLQIAAGS